MQEQTLSSKIIYQGKVVTLKIDEVTLPNGRMSEREIVEHPGAVAIIPLADNGEIIMVKQFRKPVDQVLYEIPAGKLEKGEEPIACAHRELSEETGLKAAKLTKVLEFFTTPGFSDEIMHLYLAEGLVSGEQFLDSDEFLQLEQVPLTTLLEMIAQGEIKDAKTIIGLFWLARELNGGK